MCCEWGCSSCFVLLRVPLLIYCLGFLEFFIIFLIDPRPQRPLKLIRLRRRDIIQCEASASRNSMPVNQKRESNKCPWDLSFLLSIPHHAQFSLDPGMEDSTGTIIIITFIPVPDDKKGHCGLAWVDVCVLWVVIIHKPLKLGAKTCTKLHGWLLEKAFRCTQLISGWMFRSVSLQDVWAPLIIWRRKS